MTMPAPDAPRKRPRRFWLFAPYGLLVIAIIVWSVVWLSVRSSVLDRMDAAAGRLRSQGYIVDWKARSADGYPFRLDITLDHARLIEPSGWGLTAPRLKGQAYAYNLDNWIVVAADGLTLTRPKGGAVDISAQALRASFAGFEHTPPRVAVEGLGLRFTPQRGAAPFSITEAAQLGLYLRPSGADGAEMLLRLAGAKAPPQTLLGRISGRQPLALIGDAIASKMPALSGRDWPEKARHWAAGGGQVRLAHADLTAGARRLSIEKGLLGLDADGALHGGLTLNLGRGPNVVDNIVGGEPFAAQAAKVAIDGLALLGGPVLIEVRYQDGKIRLGPVPIGPAPRFY